MVTSGAPNITNTFGFFEIAHFLPHVSHLAAI